MKNLGVARLALDSAIACLLLLALALVYLWDSGPGRQQVATASHSPGLMNSSRPTSTKRPGPTQPAAVPKQPKKAKPSSDNDSQQAKPKAPAKTNSANDGLHETKQQDPKAKEPSSVAPAPQSTQPRYTVDLTPPPPPEPEPPPVVVKKLLTQTDLNEFGNPEGKGYGLAQTGEFTGARLLVWSVDPEVHANIFTDDNPLWAALRDKGFEIQMERENFQGRWLGEADELWVFSGNLAGMDEAAYAAVAAFVRAGKGLYLAADNEPYLVDAAQLAQRLFNTTVTGDFAGGNIIAVRGHGVTRDDFQRLGNDSPPPEVSDGNEADSPDVANRINIINRATHYVDEHPLLTDVNFIFEGVTISHIEPTSRLQTVLTAFDQQALAAVSTEAGERVIVDCGWTRYYYSSQGHFVTETAGTIRYAENIAAYLMGKDDKRLDWSKWAQRRPILEKYKKATPEGVVAAFENADPEERWAAVAIAGKRKLDVPEALVKMLKDPEADIRQQARLALRGLAGGADFGPAENADQDQLEASIQAWTGWLERQKLFAQLAAGTPDEIAAAMQSDDAGRRWAAVAAAGKRRLDLPDTFIALLADADLDVRQQSRKALVQLAGGADFGPQPEADETANRAAIVEWRRWRVLSRFPAFQSATAETLAEDLQADDPDRRWAAAIVVHRRKLPLAGDLIELLGDADSLIRQEARLALVQLAKGEDYGPEADASEADAQAAGEKWREWWVRTSEKSAAQKLQLAKRLLEDSPDAAQRRLREIVTQYKGTEAAKEAKRLLEGKR